MVEEVRGYRVFYRRNRMDRHYRMVCRPFPQALFSWLLTHVCRSYRYKVAHHG